MSINNISDKRLMELIAKKKEQQAINSLSSGVQTPYDMSFPGLNAIRNFSLGKQPVPQQGDLPDVSQAPKGGAGPMISTPPPNVAPQPKAQTTGVAPSTVQFEKIDVPQTGTIPNSQPGVSQPQQQIPQQFIYETPAAKNEVLDFMEQFARQYPAMQEQDRRRQMQAALLAPVIQNDKFVNTALGQGQVATTAKQLELLNTAANARVSEAQRPLLAQAFVKAGMPAELAYASEDQLKSIANVLVTGINRDSAIYKANMAAQLGKYKADSQLEGVRIATAAKQGPEKLLQELAKAGYSIAEAEGFVEKIFGTGWRNMIGTGAPIQFNLGVGQVSGPEVRDFYPEDN